MNEERVRAYIRETAQSELFTLHKLGGDGLARLAMDIYEAFGMSPGDDEAIAARLSRLPMEVKDRLPSFVYPIRFHRTRRLWNATDPNGRGTLGFTIRSNANGYADVSPIRTPITDALIAGAAKMHDTRGRHQSDGMLRLHLVMITGRTAAIKGLLW